MFIYDFVSIVSRNFLLFYDDLIVELLSEVIVVPLACDST